MQRKACLRVVKSQTFITRIWKVFSSTFCHIWNIITDVLRVKTWVAKLWDTQLLVDRWCMPYDINLSSSLFVRKKIRFCNSPVGQSLNNRRINIRHIRRILIIFIFLTSKNSFRQAKVTLCEVYILLHLLDWIYFEIKQRHGKKHFITKLYKRH